MHIVLLYQHYLAKGESGHSRFNELAQIWSSAGHKVSVITSQVSYMTGQKSKKYKSALYYKEQDGEVDVYRAFVPDNANKSFLSRTAAYFAFALTSALTYFRIRGADIILVSSPPLTVGLGAHLIKVFSSVPIIFEVRDLWPESAITTGVLKNKHIMRALYWLERTCYRKAHKIVVLTQAFKDNILARQLKAEKEIETIPCGVNTQSMHPGNYSQAVRDELGWADKKVVLYTGAIGRANQLQQLVETAQKLHSRKDLLIAIVGDGMEKETIVNEIRERELSNIYVQGPFSKDRMPSIIATADICIAVLMKNDTFKTVYPNKVFDYMSCGKPVVLGIDGIIRELVESIGAGIFVEPENAMALAEAIIKIADNPHVGNKMGQNGRSYVESNFDRREIARKYLDIMEVALET